MLGEQAKPDQPAPVLADQGDVAQVEVVEDQLAGPLDQPGVGVVGLVDRFVGAAETDQVGHHAPNPILDEHPDHVPVEERPRRLTVQQQRYRPVGRSRVDIGHAQGATVGISDLGVCRLPGEVGIARRRRPGFERSPCRSVWQGIGAARGREEVKVSRHPQPVQPDYAETVVVERASNGLVRHTGCFFAFAAAAKGCTLDRLAGVRSPAFDPPQSDWSTNPITRTPCHGTATVALIR